MTRWFATLALLALLLGGCALSTAPRQTSSSAGHATIEVELTIDVSVDNGKVTVTATSNLPDGTKLGGTVFAEGKFMAQDPQVLQGGAATFGPFSDGGGAIPPGTYEVSVTMPVPEVQPDEVRAIIGEHGEYLTGSQVNRDDGPTVEVTQTITIK